MDPNANLREQLELAKSLLAAFDEDTGPLDEHDTARLCELVLALDQWIHGHGFLPDAWRDETPKED
jgi:hypothetical protein